MDLEITQKSAMRYCDDMKTEQYSKHNGILKGCLTMGLKPAIHAPTIDPSLGGLS